MKRRDFIRTGLLAGAALQFPHIWIPRAEAQLNRIRVTILQTNDTHSRIDPFPMDGGRNQGKGGIARRSALVRRIREQNPHTLLLDAGDVLQGTPYFNMFKGKVEYQTMTRCGYDATTLGNHEFDNGVDMLAAALNYAQFDVVNCNFDFGTTPLARHVKTFIVHNMGPVKVGITGVGVDFRDLVAGKNHAGVSYAPPFKRLQSVVNYLRKDLGCALVVVLSHLGYKPYQGKPGDTDLAQKVHGIDLIIGGHSHTFMKEPDVLVSKNGHQTRILQVGWAGILLGRTDFMFEGPTLSAVETSLLPVESSLPADERITKMLG